MKISTLETLPIQTLSHDSLVEKKVFLKYGEVPHLAQFAQTIIKPGEQATLHNHQDMTETFYFQSGIADMQVDQKFFKVYPGTVVTVVPPELHEIKNNGTEDLVIVYFGIVHDPISETKKGSLLNTTASLAASASEE